MGRALVVKSRRSFGVFVAGFGVVAIAAAPVAIADQHAATAVVASRADALVPIDFDVAWEQSFANKYASITTGSAGVGVLDDQGISLIVGTTSGHAIALHATDGSYVDGWPYSTGGTSIDSTPSVSGSGETAQVYFGVGTSSAPSKGGYLALKANGTRAWYKRPHLLPSSSSSYRGVMSSLAVGNLQTGTDIVGGSMGQMQLAMRSTDGATLKGFPWLQADTNFSTPAVAKLFAGNARDYIIEGGDSTAGVSYYSTYKRGGHIRILRPNGWYGYPYKNRGLVCQYNTNQVVQSSPAVGPFLAGGANGIVVGTGKFYSNASDTNKVIAIDTACKKKWSKTLDDRTLTSPALADVEGNGTLDVVMMSNAATVYALNGADGTELWKTDLPDVATGSPTTFRAPGGDFQYIVAPTKHAVKILDGRTGEVVYTLADDMTIRSAVTMTADPDGTLGLTVAGAHSTSAGNRAFVRHYTFVGSSVTTVQTPGAWPMFHHDPQLTGYAKEFEIPTS
jgi:hypothetical protein